MLSDWDGLVLVVQLHNLQARVYQRGLALCSTFGTCRCKMSFTLQQLHGSLANPLTAFFANCSARSVPERMSEPRVSSRGRHERDESATGGLQLDQDPCLSAPECKRAFRHSPTVLDANVLVEAWEVPVLR